MPDKKDYPVGNYRRDVLVKLGIIGLSAFREGTRRPLEGKTPSLNIFISSCLCPATENRSTRSGFRFGHLLPHGKQVLVSPQVHHAVRKGRGGHQRFAHFVNRQQFRRLSRLHLKNETILAGEVDLTVRRHWRGTETI